MLNVKRLTFFNARRPDQGLYAKVALAKVHDVSGVGCQMTPKLPALKLRLQKCTMSGAKSFESFLQKCTMGLKSSYRVRKYTLCISWKEFELGSCEESLFFNLNQMKF